MRGLRNKIAIVTGGAAGIGAAICERFKEEGSKVAVFDLSFEKHIPGEKYKIDISSQTQVIALFRDFAGEGAAFITGQVLSVSGGLTTAG